MTGSSFPFGAISLFVTNIMVSYVVLDTCVQLDSGWDRDLALVRLVP